MARHLIIDHTLVPHTAFQEASRRLEQCFTFARDAHEPICVAIFGESRTGKSRSLEECYSRHAPYRDDEGLNVPVLRVKTPSKPTVKGLVALMLRAMRDPKWNNVATEIAKTERLQTLMLNAGTTMVMIDEFQHFYDKASDKVMHHVADWLKILVDDTNVALVVAGLPYCRAVIDQNEQLAGRFLSPVVMPRFDWRSDDNRAEFTGILGAFHEAMSQHFDIPDLHTGDMAFRFYCATGGLMGYLTKMLRQAVWNASEANKETITLEDLALAYQEALWKLDDMSKRLNPFHRGFVAIPTQELLAQVATLGTREQRPSRRRGSGLPKQRIESLQSAFAVE